MSWTGGKGLRWRLGLLVERGTLWRGVAVSPFFGTSRFGGRIGGGTRKRNVLTLRETVSVLSIFKNPIILLSLVSMGLFFGMPKLVENSKSRSPRKDR